MDIQKLNDLVFLYAGKREPFSLADTVVGLDVKSARSVAHLIYAYSLALYKKRDVISSFDKEKAKDAYIDLLLCSYLESVLASYFPDVEDITISTAKNLRENAEEIIYYALVNKGFPIDEAREYAVTFVSTVPKESYKEDRSWLKKIWLNLKKFLTKQVID